MPFNFPMPDKIGKATNDLLFKKIYTKDRSFEITRKSQNMSATTSLDVGSSDWDGELELSSNIQGIDVTGTVHTNNAKSFELEFPATSEADVTISVGNTNGKRPHEDIGTVTVKQVTDLWAARVKVERVNNERDELKGTFVTVGASVGMDNFAVGVEAKADTDTVSDVATFDKTYGLTYIESGFEAFVKSTGRIARYKNDQADKKDKTSVSYTGGICQRVDDNYTFGVQIEFKHEEQTADEKGERKFVAKDPSLTLGAEYRIDSSTTVKAKVDTAGKGEFAVRQAISSAVVELSASFEKSNIKGHGFKVSLGD